VGQSEHLDPGVRTIGVPDCVVPASKVPLDDHAGGLRHVRTRSDSHFEDPTRRRVFVKQPQPAAISRSGKALPTLGGRSRLSAVLKRCVCLTLVTPRACGVGSNDTRKTVEHFLVSAPVGFPTQGSISDRTLALQISDARIIACRSQEIDRRSNDSEAMRTGPPVPIATTHATSVPRRCTVPGRRSDARQLDTTIPLATRQVIRWALQSFPTERDRW